MLYYLGFYPVKKGLGYPIVSKLLIGDDNDGVITQIFVDEYVIPAGYAGNMLNALGIQVQGMPDSNSIDRAIQKDYHTSGEPNYINRTRVTGYEKLIFLQHLNNNALIKLAQDTGIESAMLKWSQKNPQASLLDAQNWVAKKLGFSYVQVNGAPAPQPVNLNTPSIQQNNQLVNGQGNMPRAFSSDNVGQAISPNKLGNIIVNESRTIITHELSGESIDTLENIARANSKKRAFDATYKTIERNYSSQADRERAARNWLADALVSDANAEATEEIEAVTATGTVTKMGYCSFSKSRPQKQDLQDLVNALCSGVVLITVMKKSGTPTTFAGSANRQLLNQYYGVDCIKLLELNQAIYRCYVSPREGNYSLKFNQSTRQQTVNQYPDGNPCLKIWSAAIRIRKPKQLGSGRFKGLTVNDASGCEYSINCERVMGAWHVDALEQKGNQFAQVIMSGMNINLDPDLVRFVYSGSVTDQSLESYVRGKVAGGTSETDIQNMVQLLVEANNVDNYFIGKNNSFTKANLTYLASKGISVPK